MQAQGDQTVENVRASFERALEPGEVSAPVESTIGLHLIELGSRTVTPLATVEAELRKELARGPAKPAEVRALRAELLERSGFRRR